MINTDFSLPVLHNSIGIMTPFLLAGLGGLMTELSGMLNIALEGLILIGAFFSIIMAAATGSLWLGLILGVLFTVLLATVFGYITLYLKSDVFITGLAVNLLVPGLITIISFHAFGTKGVLIFNQLPELPILDGGMLNGIPLLGDILFGHNIFVYFSLLLVIVFYIIIYRTPFGFRLRASGNNPRAMKALGLKPRHYQLIAIMISGLTCAIAGAFLTFNLEAYTPNISAGRGWIALVVIYLGNKTPQGILVAAFIFGLTESISNYAQGFLNIPADFILAFPFILTVVAMVIMSIINKRRSNDPRF
ncbi:MAG: ABC transporter permease [Spirochaetales bacterium]|nr:ABC transporter permease [Spirochaetales bacterium]